MPLIEGTTAAEILNGTAGRDTLNGFAGNDTINGAGGDDALIGREGSDILNGGDGNDEVAYFIETGTNGVTIDLGNGQAIDTYGTLDTLVSIEIANGTDMNDRIFGSNGNDRLFGRAGDDLLDGLDGDNLIFTGAGNDTVRIGTTLADARDTVVIDGRGTNVIRGGDSQGTNFGHHIVFRTDSAVTANMATGVATSDGMRTTWSDSLFFLELNGSAYNDMLIGGNPRHDDLEWFVGFQGNDTLDGGTGTNDTAIYDDEVLIGQLNYQTGQIERGTQGAVVDLAAGTATDTFGDTDTLINIDDVRATSFVDDLTGNDLDNGFWGLAGADIVRGGAGTDRIHYDEDYINGGTAAVSVDLRNQTGTDGYGDTDTLISIEEVHGTQFGDTIIGDDAINRLFGRDGNDQLNGQGGDDSILGGDGNDYLRGAAGDDRLRGGLGNDTLDGGAGGGDVARYLTSTTGVRADLFGASALDGLGGTDTYIDLEGIHGSLHNDELSGAGSDDILFGLTGDDTLQGFGGRDTLAGNEGADIYIYNAGDSSDIINDGGTVAGDIDTIMINGYLPSHVRVYRQNSATQTIVLDFDNDDNSFNAGDQIAIANMATQGNALAIERVVFANGEVWTQAEVLAQLGGTLTEASTTATEFNDVLIGSEGVDRFDGLGGNDVITALHGNDRIQGGAGSDTIHAGDGSDNVNGGDGDDVINGGDTFNDLRDNIFGGAGNDNINGGFGNDELRGDAGHDTLEGGFGADTVIGADGNDVLTGQAFGDLMFGGDGNDFVNGGFGSDRVNGGTGADQFFHLGIADHGSDWIQDYNAAEGDVLVFGGTASRNDFQINTADTANAGVDGVSESFIIYRPTGQIIWALVDGDGQSQINLVLGNQTFDLTA